MKSFYGKPISIMIYIERTKFCAKIRLFTRYIHEILLQFFSRILNLFFKYRVPKWNSVNVGTNNQLFHSQAIIKTAQIYSSAIERSWVCSTVSVAPGLIAPNHPGGMCWIEQFSLTVHSESMHCTKMFNICYDTV